MIFRYRNGKDLSVEKKVFMEKIDDKTYRLVVPNVTPDESGKYTVEAINDLGSSSSTGNVDVEGIVIFEILHIILFYVNFTLLYWNV